MAEVMGAGSTLAATSTTPAAAHTGSRDFYEGVLQPGKGRIRGDHYLPSRTADVLWGYVPTVHATPVLRIVLGEALGMTQPSQLFEGADAYGTPEGSPAIVPVLRGEEVLGHAYLNSDFTPSTGYSGKPIHILVGIDP